MELTSAFKLPSGAYHFCSACLHLVPWCLEISAISREKSKSSIAKIISKKKKKVAPFCGCFILSRTLTCYVIIAGYAGQEGVFYVDFYESLTA